MFVTNLSGMVSRLLKNFFIFSWICLSFFCHFYRVANALEMDEQNRERVVLEGLIANAENKYRSIVYKNEKRGVADMRKLLKSSRVEECWVYLPEEEKWVEIGRGETPEKKVDNRYITKVSLDVQFLEELMTENSSLVVYHIHPTYTLLLEENMNERREDGHAMNANEREKERALFLMRRVFPSEQDLGNMIENTMEFYGKNPYGNVSFKISSHYGITEYRLTEKGRAHVVSNSYFECMKKIIVMCRTIKHDMAVAEEICEQKIRKTINLFQRTKMNSKQKRRNPSRIKKDFKSQIENAVNTVSNDYVKITYVPY